MPISESSSSASATGVTQNSSFPGDPLSTLVTVPGSTPVGISGKWHTQGYHALHNIQVDPSNPMNIHAIVMSAFGVTTDTSVTNFFPTRNVYYTFSADGGVTWKTPKALATTRAGYPDMILYKRGSVYVPIITDHHFTSSSITDLFSSVYVETGNPGDGKFAVGDCDRNTVGGTTGDIIWPSIAVSNDGKTLYIIASFSPPTGASANSYQNLQFGTFSLSPESGTPSNWSGWQNGPDTTTQSATLNNGFGYGQNYSIRVSPSGKLGITWLNYDLTTPDYSIYFSESKDGAKTWGVPINIFTNIPTKFKANVSPDQVIYLRASDGVDLAYDGEDAIVAFSAYESSFNNSGSPGSTNTYVPPSGSLIYWKSGMDKPIILVSQVSGDQATLDPAIDTGAYLSHWDTTHVVDPQVPNLLTPTIALSPYNKIWSIVFEAWANNDSSFPYNYKAYSQVTKDYTIDSTTILPFHSIYRITTTDGGSTWASAPVLMNDMSLPLSKHLDYRFPEVSTWNPVTNGQLAHHILFGADTAAGNWFGAPEPGFTDVGWFFKKDLQSVNSVKGNAPSGVKDLSQNYPNPFSLSTTIPVAMKNDDIVTITVSDMLGREIAVVYHGMLSAGEHQIPFTAPNAGAGIYTYTLKTSAGSVSRTMSLVK